MTRVKLVDVAKKAGVSKSTASQYLNGRYEYMSAQTKERIKLTIEEMNFTPNPIARSLKTEKTYTIGIMVRNIAGPFTSLLIRGVDDYCKEQNYNLLIYNTDYIEAIERKSIANLKSLRADGLIITSSGQINDLLIDDDPLDLPIVHVHRAFDGLNVNTVLSDFYKGSYDATNYLLSLGHTRIAVITQPYEAITSRQNRIKGIIDALKDQHMSIDQKLICVSEDNLDIAEIIEKLMALPEPPTVIFSMYTAITIAALNYLNTQSIDVPNDISIIAFDDLPLGHLLKTPITVVNQSAYELGKKSAELLFSKIADKNKSYDNVLLPCNLIIRDSCKKL